MELAVDILAYFGGKFCLVGFHEAGAVVVHVDGEDREYEGVFGFETVGVTECVEIVVNYLKAFFLFALLHKLHGVGVHEFGCAFAFS